MNRYLFVIDYQNDFVDGALGFPGAEKLDEKIAAKLRPHLFSEFHRRTPEALWRGDALWQ